MTTPVVFVDFEASSLGKKSWPVEVAWVFDDGRCESYLLKPAPGWTDWADSAERIHGLSRHRLAAEGTEVAFVAARMVDVLAGCDLYATAPSWDGKWLSALLRAGGLPRHALRVVDTLVAHRRAIRTIFEEAGVPPERWAEMSERVRAAAAAHVVQERPIHRALPDAQHELALWKAVRGLAETACGEARAARG